MTIHPLGLITTIEGPQAAINLDGATHVYAVEKNNAEAIIHITDSEGVEIASFGLAGKNALTFRKNPTDKIYASTANTHFTKIGYAN